MKLDPSSRGRAIEALASGDLDVIIVGGGITGAGAALDAATRGLRVGLVEARDLAAGTSSASSKLIHGGLRYLEMGDIGLVREALRERELLLTRTAPHLVEPVPFLWPLHGRGWERAYLGAGLLLYDTIGGARSVPRHRHLSKRRALADAPALRPDALVGAVQFHDALEDDAHMVAVVARTAAAHGAHIATRVRVTGFGGPGEIEAIDEESGESLRLRARHVAGAAGAWTDELRALAGGRSAWRNVHSKGIHVFVARDRIPMETGVLARTEKSVLFVIPWQGGWLIGDTDTPWAHGPGRPVANGADVDYLLAKTNALLAEPLTRADVQGVTAGLRPLVAEAARSDTTRISRRHVVESPAPGLTTIAGGKYTTYRVMAADLIDAVAGELGVAAPSVTREVPLLDDRAERAALLADRPELAAPLAGAHTHADVVHACTHEGALHLEDVLERRTRLALTAPDRGLEAAAPVAALMAGALDWDADRTRREVDAWHARVEAARAAEAERDDDRALAAHDEVMAANLPLPRMTELVVGLDQGTSSTRCVVLDEALSERGVASVAVESSFPAPGLVEQDAEAIAASAERAIAGALAAAGAAPGDVAALGIANQTETFVVWDRATGVPVHPAIVWQDRRTDDACAALREHEAFVRERTGLELDATFPATKLRWVLDRAEPADLAYGDVASWLLHRLGGVHVCDAGNAARSLLCPLGGADWDDELLDLFGIPRALLPPIADTDRIEATIAGVPVRAAVGDQQASLFGLRCWEPGAAKVTLGTGAFVLAHAGEAAPAIPPGVLGSTAWRRERTTSYALEGFIPTAGAAVDWFARLGVLPPPQQLDDLLREAGDDPVVCVPALQGLGTPSWDASARGALLGLSLGTTRADVARAVVDGVLHQVTDAVEAIGVEELWVDGGLSRSDWIVQRLADLTGAGVRRTVRADSTALGAATLAGLAAGVWPSPEALPEIPLDLCAEPQMAGADRDRERDRWAAARELTAPNDLPS